jgi:glutathione S-transferase
LFRRKQSADELPQGPYYGQCMWYHRVEPENVASKKRYIEQTVRVMEVLDNILKGKKYLVGDKL